MLLLLIVCVASSGFGCQAGAPAAPTTANNYFAYITNQSDNTVTGFSLNQSTGALTRMQTVATGRSPVAVMTVGSYVYVANRGDNTISQYAIDGAGNLTPLSPATVTAGAGPTSLANTGFQSAVGQYELFAANIFDNSISMYDIGKDGTLHFRKATPSGGIGPVKITGTADFFEVINTGDASWRQFEFDHTNGDLKLITSLSLPVGDALVDLSSEGGLVVDTTAKSVYYTTVNTHVASITQTLKFVDTPISVANDSNFPQNGIFVATAAGKIFQYQQSGPLATSKIRAQTAAPITVPPQQIALCSPNVYGLRHRLYVLLASSNIVQVYDSSGVALNTTTMTQATTGNGPSAIDFAAISQTVVVVPPVMSSGPNVLVADAGNGRIVGMDKIPPTSFTGYGTFYSPYSVAFDAQGRLYIGDYQPGSSTITRVDDLKGTNKTVYAPPGSTSSIVYVDKAGKIYFRDDNQKINRMDDMTGKNLVSIGAPAVNLGSPNGIAVDSKNRIYVTDGDHQVIRFDDMTGKNLISFGTIGNGTGQFSGIQGLAIDSSDRIYIADGNNARIVRIDNVDSGANWTAYTIPLNAGNLVLPRSIAVSGGSTPIIYFVDGASTAIYKMEDMTGKNLIPYGTSGAGSGQFSYPAGIAAK